MGLLDFFGDEHTSAYKQVNAVSEGHQAKLSHELIAAAASYEAAKAYENHRERNGKPDSHAKAKEIMAGAAGAFIDRLVETKGLDYAEAQKAKHHAQRKAEEALANSGEY